MAPKRSREDSARSSAENSQRKRRSVSAAAASHPLFLSKAKYASKDLIEEVSAELTRMGLYHLANLTWALVYFSTCKEFVDYHANRASEGNRVSAVAFSKETFAQVYRLPAEGIHPRRVESESLVEYFDESSLKRDGYSLDECKNETLKKLLKALNPVFLPERSNEVRRMMVAAVVRAWKYPDSSIDWAGFLHERFLQLGENLDGKKKRCFLSPYLFHIYGHFGKRTEGESEYYERLSKDSSLQGGPPELLLNVESEPLDSEPAGAHRASRNASGEDAEDETIVETANEMHMDFNEQHAQLSRQAQNGHPETERPTSQRALRYASPAMLHINRRNEHAESMALQSGDHMTVPAGSIYNYDDGEEESRASTTVNYLSHGSTAVHALAQASAQIPIHVPTSRASQTPFGGAIQPVPDQLANANRPTLEFWHFGADVTGGVTLPNPHAHERSDEQPTSPNPDLLALVRGIGLRQKEGSTALCPSGESLHRRDAAESQTREGEELKLCDKFESCRIVAVELVSFNRDLSFKCGKVLRGLGYLNRQRVRLRDLPTSSRCSQGGDDGEHWLLEKCRFFLDNAWEALEEVIEGMRKLKVQGEEQVRKLQPWMEAAPGTESTRAQHLVAGFEDLVLRQALDSKLVIREYKYYITSIHFALKEDFQTLQCALSEQSERLLWPKYKSCNSLCKQYVVLAERASKFSDDLFEQRRVRVLNKKVDDHMEPDCHLDRSSLFELEELCEAIADKDASKAHIRGRVKYWKVILKAMKSYQEWSFASGVAHRVLTSINRGLVLGDPLERKQVSGNDVLRPHQVVDNQIQWLLEKHRVLAGQLRGNVFCAANDMSNFKRSAEIQLSKLHELMEEACILELSDEKFPAKVDQILRQCHRTLSREMSDGEDKIRDTVEVLRFAKRCFVTLKETRRFYLLSKKDSLAGSVEDWDQWFLDQWFLDHVCLLPRLVVHGKKLLETCVRRLDGSHVIHELIQIL